MDFRQEKPSELSEHNNSKIGIKLIQKEHLISTLHSFNNEDWNMLIHRNIKLWYCKINLKMQTEKLTNYKKILMTKMNK